MQSIKLLLSFLAFFWPAWASPVPQDDNTAPPADNDNDASTLVVMYEIHKYLITRIFELADHTKLVVRTLVVTIQEHCVMRVPNSVLRAAGQLPEKQQSQHQVNTDGTLPGTTLLKTFSPLERAAAIAIVVFAAISALGSLMTIGLFIYRKLTGDERKEGTDGMLVKYGFGDMEKQECQRLMDATADEEEPEVAPAYEAPAQSSNVEVV